MACQNNTVKSVLVQNIQRLWCGLFSSHTLQMLFCVCTPKTSQQVSQSINSHTKLHPTCSMFVWHSIGVFKKCLSFECHSWTFGKQNQIEQKETKKIISRCCLVVQKKSASAIWGCNFIKSVKMIKTATWHCWQPFKTRMWRCPTIANHSHLTEMFLEREKVNFGLAIWNLLQKLVCKLSHVL